MLLNELFLLEYNQALTIKNYGEKLYQHFYDTENYNYIQRLRGEIVNDSDCNTLLVAWDEGFDDSGLKLDSKWKKPVIEILVKMFEGLDPTPHKEYTQWLIRNYINSNVHVEDVATNITSLLRTFDFLKRRRLIADRDINQYNFNSLHRVVRNTHIPSKKEPEQSRGDYKEIFRNDRLIVIIPRDQEAACFWGQNTRWCTAAKDNNMFKSYNQIGSLYIIIPRKPVRPGEKYQFHFEEDQFMDEQDHDISHWGRSLVRRFPELAEIFKDYANEHQVSWLKPPHTLSREGWEREVMHLKRYSKQLKNGVYCCPIFYARRFDWDVLESIEKVFDLHLGAILEAEADHYHFFAYAIFPPDFTGAEVVYDEFEEGEELKTIGNIDQVPEPRRSQAKEVIEELKSDLNRIPKGLNYRSFQRYQETIWKKWGGDPTLS